jgi:predicted RNA binding protein YcfA (HicA-like mRNA interferase family)
MKALSGKAFAQLLEGRGWKLLRISGSHHIDGKSGSIVRLSVPIHGDTPLKIGLLRHLLKTAGLEEKDID